MVAMKDIKNLSGVIARKFRPGKIVLFGSYARGRPTADSDVDILVVMPYNQGSVRKSAEIRLALRTQFPVDVLVRSPEEIKRRLAMGDSFIESVLRDGKVLYEADDE